MLSNSIYICNGYQLLIMVVVVKCLPINNICSCMFVLGNMQYVLITIKK